MRSRLFAAHSMLTMANELIESNVGPRKVLPPGGKLQKCEWPPDLFAVTSLVQNPKSLIGKDNFQSVTCNRKTNFPEWFGLRLIRFPGKCLFNSASYGWENLSGFSRRTSNSLKLEIFRGSGGGGFLSRPLSYVLISKSLWTTYRQRLYNEREAARRVVRWPPLRRGDKMSALLRI